MLNFFEIFLSVNSVNRDRSKNYFESEDYE